MPQVKYAPKPGGTFYAPTLEPGAVIEVSRQEAEHLLATGAFEKVSKAAPAAEVPPTAAGKSR
jgi:hypothetical protein